MNEILERISLKKDSKMPLVTVREHLIRYVLALNDVYDKDVLDIACGTGYGMYLMSYIAKSVSGYDYSKEAIEEAKRFNYKCSCCLETRNLETDKSLSNNKVKNFDVITCFETIEHLKNPEILLKNIKLALKPSGVLLISTPNDIKRQDKNKWHKIHFDFYSFHDIIIRIFDNPLNKIRMWGQDQWGFTNDFNKSFVVLRLETVHQNDSLKIS